MIYQSNILVYEMSLAFMVELVEPYLINLYKLDSYLQYLF